MEGFRLPTVYTITNGELPEDYEVDCGWCTIETVTPANRWWIPVPKKNIVHQTCATGKRKYDRVGFFCCPSCALAFCFHRVGMRQYMDQVRIEAAKRGIRGIIPMAPDPLVTLRRYLPSIPETQQESETQYRKYIKDNVQVREIHHSEISSARIHKLHKHGATRETRHVLEHSSVDAPDLREPVTSIETIQEGQGVHRMGSYEQFCAAQTKQGSTKKKKSKARAKSSSSSSHDGGGGGGGGRANRSSSSSSSSSKSRAKSKHGKPIVFKSLF